VVSSFLSPETSTPFSIASRRKRYSMPRDGLLSSLKSFTHPTGVRSPAEMQQFARIKQLLSYQKIRTKKTHHDIIKLGLYL
jgi:hypothetical protein